MTGVNLSKIEAQERSKHLQVECYDVTIKVVPGQETFYSKSVVHFSCNSPGYSTFIDAPARKILSATLNGEPIDISKYDGETVFLNGLATQNELIIEMDAIFSKNGEGLQYSVDPADGEAYLYSQGGPALIRHMYACFDQPDLKATFALTAIVPKHWEVVANTLPTSKIAADDNYTTWTFPATPRLSTYITAFIAGPYHHVHDEYEGEKNIPLGIYCRKSLAPFLDSDEIFKVTKQGFDFFQKFFGLAYPFEKYDQIAVVDFNWGAMENVGAVTFKEELFVYRSKVTERVYKWRANTILHEMSHMWFGNLVTMVWWDDVWLNESFAEWAAYYALTEATDYKNGWVEFNSRRKTWALRQDQFSSTHPIVQEVRDIEDANNNFDGITYAKGASVLQQLVAHVGIDNFTAGLRAYFKKHAYGNTTLRDLLAEMETSSGRDLSPWSATWLETAGVNTLRPVIEISNGAYSSLAISQEPPAMPSGSKQLRPHRLAVGLYDLERGELVRRKSVELDVAGSLTNVAELTGEKVADLLLLNDGDMSYAKIRFDKDSLATLEQHLGAISDPLARTLCWSATWDMLRDAEISASDFVDIALAGLKSETEISVINTVTEQLSTTVDLYSHPSLQQDLRARVAADIEALMDRAEPESDLQLLFAQAFLRVATTFEQNQRLLALLAGEVVGLKIDADLRWLLVCALAERGLISKNDLDDELEKDNTTLGALGHGYALAAIPSAPAKEIAWEAIIDEGNSNAARVAAMKGFHRPLQSALIESYIPKYFGSLDKIWAGKSLEAATQFVGLMFPAYATTQPTLDAANNWLNVSGKDSPSGLRRLVAEARDSLARALKVQSRQ